MLSLLLRMVERGWVPDPLIRRGIRGLCADRLDELRTSGPDQESRVTDFVARLSEERVAPVPEKANEQHYELPPEFFEMVLGPRLKYSGCTFPGPAASLAEAEDTALSQVVDRAGIADGMRVLELGCGWGSLTLWLAQQFPRTRITAVSNSHPQRRHIEGKLEALGLHNVQVITADMNVFAPPAGTGPFDRIVSVEMFEHMRNYSQLFHRIASWLPQDGLLFLHVFCHRSVPYSFETEGPDNWLGRYFFTGGTMPSEHLFEHFPESVQVLRRWQVDGTHYQRTAEAWLANLDRRSAEILPILAATYGREARVWFHRWRVFFLACAELFGMHDGHEWFVSHQLLAPAAIVRTP